MYHKNQLNVDTYTVPYAWMVWVFYAVLGEPEKGCPASCQWLLWDEEDEHLGTLTFITGNPVGCKNQTFGDG